MEVPRTTFLTLFSNVVGQHFNCEAGEEEAEPLEDTKRLSSHIGVECACDRGHRVLGKHHDIRLRLRLAELILVQREFCLLAQLVL